MISDHLRKDTLLNTAEIIVAVNEIATQVPGNPTLVGTVATINVFRQAGISLQKSVFLPFDLRDIDLEKGAISMKTITRHRSYH